MATPVTLTVGTMNLSTRPLVIQQQPSCSEYITYRSCWMFNRKLHALYQTAVLPANLSYPKLPYL